MRIAIPVETIVRELKGKLWLALNLIQNDHKVVFGELSSIKQGIDVIEPDVFFRTSTVYSKTKLDQNYYLKKNGSKIVVLDTEGGAFKTVDHYQQRRLHDRMLETTDRFFAWGERSAKIVNTTGSFPKERIIVTGNPRFDVLQKNLRHIYQDEASEIKSKFGHYVLINTNFGEVNSHSGSKISEENTEEFNLFKKFIDLCYEIADSIPDTTVIIRPHPGENHNTYNKKFSDESKICVEHNRDVRSWILGADAIIHNNCTTGIEAALMDRPVYAYTPKGISRDHTHTSNIISKNVETPKEVISYINSSKNNQDADQFSMKEKNEQALKQYIHNIDYSATDEIVREINQLNGDWTEKRTANVSIHDKIKRRSVQYLGVNKTERYLSALFNKDYSKLRQKFPELTEKQLINEIKKFSPNINVSEIQIDQFDQLGFVYELSK